MPCVIRRRLNSTAVFDIQFTAKKRVNTINTVVTRRNTFGWEQAYPLPAHVQNGCNNLIVGSCPLVFIRSARQRLQLPLGSTLFDAPLVVRFRVSQLAQNNSTISCFEVDFRTVL